jgi:flotillin
MEFLALLTVLGILGVGTGSSILVVRNLYYICQPNEVLIFAGSSRKLADGRRVGYRLVKGGSSLRMPFLEKVLWMDLSNMNINLQVVNAYSKGGIPLTVEGVANIKIAGEEPIIHNAIERLLGKEREEIECMAKETLEGNLRGVLASLTPEQVNEDKIAFARSLLDEAEEDLEKLGLVLDSLQIQNISDNVRYLSSIGRKKQADLLRDARIAEAHAQSESEIQTAENEKMTTLRRIDRDIEVFRSEAERRLIDTRTMRGAIIAEAEAEIAAELARIQAEVPVQQARIKKVEQELKADVLAPAEANCKQAIAQAQGEAAQILESGKAQVEGSRRIAASWQAAGSQAREIFVLQRLENLVAILCEAVPELTVENMTLVDNPQGNLIPQLTTLLAQLKQTTGLDLIKLLQDKQQNPSELPPILSDSERLLRETVLAETDPPGTDPPETDPLETDLPGTDR